MVFLLIGWNGSSRHWLNYEKAYLILAAIATPLVLSVHSIVSFDFATSNLPGWHTTIVPTSLYFVAGAIFSGFAMVLDLTVYFWIIFGLEELVTIRHLENMNKFILATGTMVGYAYAMEFLLIHYSANQYEAFCIYNYGPLVHMHGHIGLWYLAM